MKTTIYQKFIARYAETFTLVCIEYDDDEFMEVVPTAKVKDMDQEEYFALLSELIFWQNEKATWEE